jgi:hypothetical protein
MTKNAVSLMIISTFLATSTAMAKEKAACHRPGRCPGDEARVAAVEKNFWKVDAIGQKWKSCVLAFHGTNREFKRSADEYDEYVRENGEQPLTLSFCYNRIQALATIGALGSNCVILGNKFLRAGPNDPLNEIPIVTQLDKTISDIIEHYGQILRGQIYECSQLPGAPKDPVNWLKKVKP